MDHFWISPGPFWTILLTVLSNLCQWSCGHVDHFLEVKLLEQVNLHFWIIFCNTHCWFNMLLCTCTMSHLYLEVTFLDHFCEHEFVDYFFFGTYTFDSYFFVFLELTFLDHFCFAKFQKRNDPPICVEMIHKFVWKKYDPKM